VGHIVIALVSALAIAAGGCKKSNPQARTVTPPTAEEADAFAKDFAAKLVPCDGASIDQLVDMDLMVSRALAGREGFDKAGFMRGLGSLGKIMCTQLQHLTVRVKYLRTQQYGGAPRPLIRLLSEAGLNYYELELDKQGTKTRLADIYIMLAGEKLSETLGSLVDTAQRSGIGEASKIKLVRQHMQAGRWQEAHALLLTLPSQMRAAKAIKLIEIQITGELGDELYLKSLNEYTKAFPGDPSLALVSIDRALLRKEYDTALAYLADLDKRIGGDPYLDVLRAGTLASAGKLDEAITAAKRATEREPTLEDAWWQLLTQQAASKRYAEAIPTLEMLRDKFGAVITPESLAADERFGGLAASPEYIAWSKPR